MFVAVDEGFPEHPKTLRLCATLDNELAWAYLVRLWRWAMRYAKDGDLSKYEPAELEMAVGWHGEQGKFHSAAVKAGFIDEAPLRIHDWMEHNGKWAEKAEKDRVRKELARLGEGKRNGRPKRVRRTSDG